MIHFHVSANSIDELESKIREALGVRSHTTGECGPTTDDRIVQAVESGVIAPELLDRAIEALDAADAPTTPAQPEQPKEIQPKTYELADVRAAANAYRDKHGIEKLREIFKKHGGEKLKDIPASNYEALMKEIA